VIICAPVSKYRLLLHNIASSIKKEQKIYIGTVYGQGGFNWMVKEIIDKFNLMNVVTFAIGLIPWICRIREYGKVGITYGAKQVNCVAVSPITEYEYLSKTILDDICYNWFGKGKFVLSDNFLSFTLSVDNQIIHPSRMYSIYHETGGEWEAQTNVPFFYSDYDDFSANTLKELDDDYEKIRSLIKERYQKHDFKYMLNYLALERLSYGSHNENIKESFLKSETLGLIKTPTIQNKLGKWELNRDHRFFYDDIYYGLCIAKWFAIELEVETPIIDKILVWSEKMLDDKVIENNKLIKPSNDQFKYGDPSEYGIKDIEALIEKEQ